jgi:hypothetical protein
VHINSVVIPDTLTSENSGSKNAETTHITTKYDAPAASPHKNLRQSACFEKSIPAISDETQYISMTHTLTIHSLISALYNMKATIRSRRALVRYAAIRHLKSATAFFKIHTS